MALVGPKSLDGAYICEIAAAREPISFSDVRNEAEDCPESLPENEPDSLKSSDSDG
jgi:hypothetical protein